MHSRLGPLSTVAAMPAVACIMAAVQECADSGRDQLGQQGVRHTHSWLCACRMAQLHLAYNMPMPIGILMYDLKRSAEPPHILMTPPPPKKETKHTHHHYHRWGDCRCETGVPRANNNLHSDPSLSASSCNNHCFINGPAVTGTTRPEYPDFGSTCLSRPM